MSQTTTDDREGHNTVPIARPLLWSAKNEIAYQKVEDSVSLGKISVTSCISFNNAVRVPLNCTIILAKKMKTVKVVTHMK